MIKESNRRLSDDELAQAAFATKWSRRTGQDWATKCPFHFGLQNNSSLRWDSETGRYQCCICQKEGTLTLGE
ncbi:hypothetical protein KAT92_05685 [Candidatus Babeliales bacterium]|nr:hypothetical protein [Candidatus Babeliales bacterium]